MSIYQRLTTNYRSLPTATVNWAGFLRCARNDNWYIVMVPGSRLEVTLPTATANCQLLLLLLFLQNLILLITRTDRVEDL